MYYYTAQKPRGKKPLWGGGGGGGGRKEEGGRRKEGGLSGGERLLTAINLIFKTCSLQSNDAILIINVLVLDSGHWHQSKKGDNFKLCTRNKLFFLGEQK